MRVLLVTQAIDTDDPVLGFFVRWVDAIARQVERVEVICLRKGAYTLPDNVRVYALRERDHTSRLRIVLRFYRHLWSLRNAIDVVMVHMNPEYVILGGLWWRIRGVRVTLWYNHPYRGLRLRAAAWLAHRVFYTSPYAATASSKKAVRMPAGIDTALFTPRAAKRDRFGVYFQGRVAPSKRAHLLLEAVRLLRVRGVPAVATLVGPEERAYGTQLRSDFDDLFATGGAVLLGPRRNDETPELFSAQGVSVNLAAAGHYDKSVLEALACETPVVTSSPAFSDIIPGAWIVREDTPEALAQTLQNLMTLSNEEYCALGASLRTIVEQRESLALLVERLVQQWKP